MCWLESVKTLCHLDCIILIHTYTCSVLHFSSLYISDKCPPGQYFDVNSGFCKNCSRGFYQPKTGQFSCLPCDPDKTTKFTGTVEKSSCASEWCSCFHKETIVVSVSSYHKH